MTRSRQFLFRYPVSVAAVATVAFFAGTRFDGRQPAVVTSVQEPSPQIVVQFGETAPRAPFLVFRETEPDVRRMVFTPLRTPVEEIDEIGIGWGREMEFAIDWDPAKRCYIYAPGELQPPGLRYAFPAERSHTNGRERVYDPTRNQEIYTFCLGGFWR